MFIPRIIGYTLLLLATTLHAMEQQNTPCVECMQLGKAGISLVKVVERNHSDCLAVLLAKGCDVNKQEDAGQTALHEACLCNYSAIATILLEHNADPNIKNDDGMTPLHIACFSHNNEELVQSLIAHQAAINCRCKVREGYSTNSTPLHLACSRRHEKVVKVLLANNADVTLKAFDDNKTALDIATEKKYQEIIALFECKN